MHPYVYLEYRTLHLHIKDYIKAYEIIKSSLTHRPYLDGTLLGRDGCRRCLELILDCTKLLQENCDYQIKLL